MRSLARWVLSDSGLGELLPRGWLHGLGSRGYGGSCESPPLLLVSLWVFLLVKSNTMFRPQLTLPPSSIFSASSLLITLLVLPPDCPSHTFGLGFPFRSRPFDVLGTLLLCLSLGLFNFSWNQSAVTGWSESYVWVILILALICFVAFYLWERYMDTKALIPTEVLSRNSLLVYGSLWLGWMSLGVFLLYTTFLYVLFSTTDYTSKKEHSGRRLELVEAPR